MSNLMIFENKHEWRRFELIDEKNEDKLLKLISEKRLSREDLMLILKTIKLRDFDKI